MDLNTLLTKVLLPISLLIIMFGLGTSLMISDFTRVLKIPRAVLIGIVSQMILLPLLALGLISLFKCPYEIALGVLILSLCPGGVTSNFYSFIAKGDLALSVTLTAIVSLVTPISIPLVTNWYISQSGLLQGSFTLPFMQTVIQLLAITVVPLGLGMITRHFKPTIHTTLEKPISIFGLLFLLSLILIYISENWMLMPQYLSDAGAITITLNSICMILGFCLAVVFHLNKEQQITITFETGIQNVTTTLFVTMTILQSQTLAIPGIVYGIFMFISGFLATAYFRYTYLCKS